MMGLTRFSTGFKNKKSSLYSEFSEKYDNEFTKVDEIESHFLKIQNEVISFNKINLDYK